MRVPLQAVPNQTLAITLAKQPVQIALRENDGNLYLDLMLRDEQIVRTRICRDRQRMLLDVEYRGFVGDLAFVDTQGADDPQYYGLGVRWQLYYLGADE